MTEANELRARVQATIDQIQRIQVSLMKAKADLEEVRQDILLFSITETNRFTMSAARIITGVGHEIEIDQEGLGQAQSELTYWQRTL